MKNYKEFNYHFALFDIESKRNKYDQTIYTFDIETTNYLIYKNQIIPASQYDELTQDIKDLCQFRSTMYIWMFSINDDVYYGRSWNEFIVFLDKLTFYNPHKKIIFVHNLSFEFQFLKSILKFDEVMARKKHKVIKAICDEYNLEFRCSYMMSNSALQYLPNLFNLPVEKKVGDLDYDLIRTSITPLSDKELGYCEYDCLVVYYYIKHELEEYKQINKIPLTSTGHVRRELKDRVLTYWSYKNKIKKSINTDPHIYNLLVEVFTGGYTHSNRVFTDEVLRDITSYDFTSSYPYVLVTHKFPSREFKPCKVNKVENMISNFAYIIVVELKGIKSKYYNTFLSRSKCREVTRGIYDNGRIIQADSCIIALTDIDFRLILDSYHIESYNIIESYYSIYNYLPEQFINFVLDKYVNKTKYKNVPGKEIEYSKEKNKYNSLYGMSVTNTIRDEVIFDNITGWDEIELTNEEILEKLKGEKKQGFLNFATGVWVTAHARNNLIRNIIALDNYVIYSDTDSIKLRPRI